MPRRFVVTHVEEHWVEEPENVVVSSHRIPATNKGQKRRRSTVKKVATAGLVVGVAALLIGAASSNGSAKRR